MKLAKLKTAILALGLGLGVSTSVSAISSAECDIEWTKCVMAGNTMSYCDRVIGCHPQ